MPRTTQNPLLLPRLQAFGSRPIADVSSPPSGPEAIAQALQAAYEQQLGCLALDTHPAAGLQAPLYYRIKNMKREAASALAPLWRCGVRLSSTGGAEAVCTVDGVAHALPAWSLGSVAEEHTGDFTHPASVEYSDVALALSGDVGYLHSCRLQDLGSRHYLSAGVQPSGLVFHEEGKLTADRPVSVARSADLCALGRSLFQRQCGQIIATANAAGLWSGDRTLRIPAPMCARRGGMEHTASLWVMGDGYLEVETGQGTYARTLSTALGTWDSTRLTVRDWSPEEGATPAPSVSSWRLRTVGDLYAVSCYWDDLPAEAYP